MRALARRAGTSHSTLAAYEAGRKAPSLATLERIVKAAGFELSVEARPGRGHEFEAERDGQARVWWDATPVDVFLNTTEFHAQAATRARQEELGGRQLPFLGCTDLAVFKAFFNRTRDWADLEEMAAAGSLDVASVSSVLAEYLGKDVDRITRLRAITGPPLR